MARLDSGILEVLGWHGRVILDLMHLFTGLADLVSERQLPSFVFSGIAYISSLYWYRGARLE